MNKLISASSLALFKSTFPDWADNSSQVFKSIAFTNDGYLYTHGKIFQMSVYGTENPWGLSFDLNNQDLSVTVAGYTDSIKLPVINIQSDDLTIIPSNGIFNISHPNLFNNQINIGPTTSSDTSINIPYVTINNTGHIITADSKVATLNHVYQQADNTTNSNGYLLLGHSLLSGTNNVTAVSRYSNKLYANPVTGELYASSLYEGTTALANKYVALSHISVEASDIILGHVKLSDSVSSSANTSQGIAATPKAVLDSLNSAKTYANSLFASNDAMIFVGTITGTGIIQTHNTSVLTQSIINGTTSISSLTYYSAGWVFKVISSGIISGIGTVESGDIIICQNDYNNSYNPSDWTIIQTNIDGAVTATSILNNNNIILGNGNKNIKYLANGTEGQYLIIDSGIPTWKTIGITMRTIKYNGLDFLSGSSATNLDLTAGSGIQLSGNNSTGVLTITSTGVQQIFGLNILNNTTLLGTYNPDIVESTLKFNGGLTASLINSEYVISHSNSITALTSQTLGKVTYDSNGHITGFTEVTSLPNPNALVIENNTGNIIDSYTGSIQKIIKFVDGNDISLTPTTLNNIITITPSIVQRYRPIAFKNIGDTNDTTVFNDSSNGTLVFIAGNNVTFSNSLGRLTINALNPWSSVTETPTTLSGYGITDAMFRDDRGATGWQANDITYSVYGFGYQIDGFPTNGSFISFGGLGNKYVTQIQGQYANGDSLYYRTRNDDNGTWNTWRNILHDGNYNSYSPTLTGVGASGTWGINITGYSSSILSGDNTATGDALLKFSYGNRTDSTLASTAYTAPSSDWWQTIRIGFGSANYFTDLMMRVNGNDGFYYKKAVAGTYYGWYRLLDSNNYSSIIDSRYVLKAGDTMTGNLAVTHSNNPWFKVRIVDTDKGEFGATSSGVYIYNANRNGLLFYRDNGSLTLENQTVWHSGNDGDGSGLDADTVDGYQSTDFTKNIFIQSGSINDFDNGTDGSFAARVEATVTDVPDPNIYNWSLWQQGNKVRGSQFLIHAYAGGTGAWLRSSLETGNTWGNWRKLAFEDSNVYSATKLQTARTIYGKTFDGTNNIAGGAKFANICIETNNTGDDTGRGSEINNYIGPLYLQYVTANSLNMCVGGGNVGIGTTDPIYKLHVNGDIYATNVLSSGATLRTAYGSDYNKKAIETRGNGNDVTAGIGFHQPGVVASTLYMDNSGHFHFGDNPGTAHQDVYARSYYADDWFRSNGATGWYNQTYCGGIYMEDTYWVRVYGGKAFYVDNMIKSTAAIEGDKFVISQGNGDGRGISLYGGSTSTMPTYGLAFATTANFGTHGYVTADWATYFTMDNTANRGWIFRNQTDGVNVFSINNSGNVKANGNFYATDNSYLVLHSANYGSILNPTYVLKSGDTMTGNLTVSALYTNNGIHDNRYNSSAFLFATDGTVIPVASFVQTPYNGVPIRALFRAYVSYSGTTQNSFGVNYNYISSSASLTRVDTGTYRLTFSGTRYVGGTFTGDGKFQIFCIGRNINGSDSNPCYIALSNPQNNSIDFICANDTSRDDGAAFTIYINYLM